MHTRLHWELVIWPNQNKVQRTRMRKLCIEKHVSYEYVTLSYVLTIPGWNTKCIFTRGQFWHSGIVVACVRPSVRPSVTKFVRAITHYPFKLGSQNLDHRCKRPWLRSLLFCGTIDLDLQGQIALQSQNLPHFELVHAITHHQLKLQFPDLEQKCILALFRSRPILGLIDIYLQF